MTITTKYIKLQNKIHRVYTATDKNFSASASTAHKAIINLLNFYN
jgi:hypothetical protein